MKHEASVLRQWLAALFALAIGCLAAGMLAEPSSAWAADDSLVEVEIEIAETPDPDSDMPLEDVQLLEVSGKDPARVAAVENELVSQAQATTPAYRDALYERLESAFRNMETSISLSDLEIPVSTEFTSTLKEVRREVLQDNPDLFWASTAESWSFKYTARAYIMKLTFSEYSFTANERDAMQAQYDAALADVLSWASYADGTANQVKAVHDWLVRNCLYNKDALIQGGPVGYGNIDPWTAYGALVEKKPVCQGYSYAFKAALDQLGIPCECIIETESDGSLHMWNRVKIGSSWYNVDVTHDDPLKAGTATDFGYAYTPRTTFFLKSDAYFRATPDTSGNISFHVNFTPNVAGTDTSYDKASWASYDENGKVANTSIADATCTVGNQAYTGSARTPSVKVVLDGKTLTSGTDYSVAYNNNVNVGTATATVTGKGAYTGSQKVTFKVTAASIANATVTGVVAKNYTGSAIKQSVTVKLGTKTLAAGTDYSVSYKNNIAAGTATVVVTGKGNYAGSVSQTFTISKVNIATNAGVTVSNIGTKTYAGKALKPGVTVRLNGVTLKQGTDYTIAYANNVKAGTATATIKGTGSCTGSVVRKFKIATFNVKKAKISGIVAKKYTGKAITQNVVVKIGGTALKKGTDFTVTYKNNKKVGTASVIIKGKGSCVGSITKTFKIKK